MRLLILGLFLVAACREQRPPTPTEKQSAQLDEAENMLNDMDADQNSVR
jgi:hypothetical protein